MKIGRFRPTAPDHKGAEGAEKARRRRNFRESLHAGRRRSWDQKRAGSYGDLTRSRGAAEKNAEKAYFVKLLRRVSPRLAVSASNGREVSEEAP